jgi:hypothetical protein
MLWNDSPLGAALVAATLLGSAVLLWQGNRWVVIYSGALAILSLGFLFFLAFSVQGPEEHIGPAALGSIAYLVLHAVGVVAEWVTAKSGPETTFESD